MSDLFTYNFGFDVCSCMSTFIQTKFQSEAKKSEEQGWATLIF